LLDEGAWEDESRDPYYEPYNTAIDPTDCDVDPTTGIISKDGKGVGIMQDGQAVKGFATPSRKFEIRSLFVEKIGRNEDCSDLIANSGTKTKNRPEQHKGHDVEIDSMPIWKQIVEHENLAANELVMTSFKWNVHNHGRTMNLKWLAEIVHSNPAWLNPKTAAAMDLKDGDWIELTSFQSQHLAGEKHLQHPAETDDQDRQIVASMRVPIVTMEGIHPKAIAMSNSCGHWQYTSVAQARRTPVNDAEHLAGSDTKFFRDADWERNMWWEDDSNGNPEAWKKNTGNGWNQNKLMPIAPDPISGQQSFHDTVVAIKKFVG
jgi:anaerobic selenocysteine-containing dehydrogenase